MPIMSRRASVALTAATSLAVGITLGVGVNISNNKVNPDDVVDNGYIEVWKDSGSQVAGMHTSGALHLSGALIIDGIYVGSGGSAANAAGQGLTVASSFVSLNAAHSGTTIEATTLLSGALVHAQNLLSSSGGLSLETGEVTIDNITYTWPAADGAASTNLQTDGAGTLSWAAAGGASVISLDDFAQSGSLLSRVKFNDVLTGNTTESITKATVTGVNAPVGAVDTAAEWCDGSSVSTDLEAGTDMHFTMADSANVSPTTAVSVFVWINVESEPATNVIYGLVVKDNGGNGSYGLWYRDASDTNYLNGKVTDAGADFDQQQVAVDLGTATWHHVGVTIDPTANEMIFFVDGQQSGSAQTITNIDDVVDSSQSLYIGTRTDGTNTFDGKMQDVMIWDAVLTPAQVLANYNLYASCML